MNKFHHHNGVKEIIFYFFSAFFIFLIGFLIVFGKQAALSGSWHYVLNHDDEYSYWAYAKGASETPMSDGNPFYFESIGTRHATPYFTANLVGYLAKKLGVPVMSFFPVWHIGMPLILWASFFFSLWKFWKISITKSAIVSLLILLSTLLIPGQPRLILLRFSRPGDGLWLVILWLSIIMNWNADNKKYLVSTVVIIVLSLMMQPIYAFYCGMVTFCEFLWQTFRRNFKNALQLFVIITITVAGGLTYVHLMRTGSNISYMALEFAKKDIVTEFPFYEITAFVCYLVITGSIICYKIRTKEPWTTLDRFALFVFLFEPIGTSLQHIVGENYQLYSHRYYFLIVEIACLTGWLAEKMPKLLSNKVLNHPIFPIALLPTIVIVHYIEKSYTALMDNSYLPIFVFRNLDNAILILQLIPIIFLIVWAIFKFKTVNKLAHQKWFIVCLISLVALSGYGFMPSQLDNINRNFPFDKAYGWLNQHAKINDVVLTIPPKFRQIDYLLLRTKLKTYYNDYGHTLSKSEKEATQRVFFYSSILMNRLDKKDVYNVVTGKDPAYKIKLNYILINKPSPFYKDLQEEFASVAVKVYEDKTSLIWKLNTPS